MFLPCIWKFLLFVSDAGVSSHTNIMTDKMIEAGVSAYLENKDNEPTVLIDAIWQAISDAEQKEALSKYWKSYE